MFISAQDGLSVLEHYRYWIIFPIAVFEGPIIIIISGFLVYLGYLNAVVAFLLLVVADTIGDSIYYNIGKYLRASPRIKRFARFFGYDEKSEEFLENHFKKHKLKTFILAKFSHGIGSSVQIAAGIARVNFFEFLCCSLIGTIPKTLALIFIGFFAGSYYQKIDSILNLIALIILSLAIILLSYFASRKIAKNLSTKKGD